MRFWRGFFPGMFRVQNRGTTEKTSVNTSVSLCAFVVGKLLLLKQSMHDLPDIPPESALHQSEP